jgi:hypothetical protein
MQKKQCGGYYNDKNENDSKIFNFNLYWNEQEDEDFWIG